MPRKRIRTRPFTLAALLALASTTVSAQAVYRCVQPGKPASYQTDPCPKGTRIDAIRGFTPERNPTANELAWKRYRTEREMAVRNRASAQQQAQYVAVPDQPSGPSCADAKAARDAWERRVGLSRTIDQLRWWQDYVQRACR